MKIWTRERSNTGIYHVISKAIEARNIFLNDQDNEVFVENTSVKFEVIL
ncbi:hypothetical protein GH810_11790 [Acetobacterium paludosum]|uniref:Uncharacterized protein n=1 Tax=Acetobacterium paludosum TaxID=52693 RepID=A0A923KX06_9FIRM|nr:hypothetical protein [Acetobacterium paludosum]MBC3888995.1 hypothetical protein [Acetobacterium paludosum]